MPTTPPPGELKRTLGLKDVVMLTVSSITPASSIFVIAPFALQSAGSGAFLSFAMAALLAICIAFCYAEVGGAHPNAGGEYVFIERLFGRFAGTQMYVLVMVMLLFIPAVLASGAATYLNTALGTSYDSATVALIMIVSCYVLGVLDIRANALVTGIFLVLEIAALVVVVWLGFTHVNQPVSLLLQPVMPDANGSMAAVPFVVMAAMVGTALFSYNGYGSAVYLAEDMQGGGKSLATAILLSLCIVVVVEILPLVALILGAPDLSELTKQADPVSYVVASLSSPTVARVVSMGIFISILNANIALVVQTGRFLFASGRDKLWPQAMNRALQQVIPKSGTPWVATLLFAIPSALLTFNSNLASLTSFTVIILLLVYIGVAVSALRSRKTETHHPYRMAFWPWVPVLTLLGVLYTLWTVLETVSKVDLMTVGGLIVVAAILAKMREKGAKA